MATSWLQIGVTIATLLGGIVIAFFKNEAVLRREILSSEERLRTRIDGVRDEVHKLDTRLAVLESRQDRGRASVQGTAPAR